MFDSRHYVPLLKGKEGEFGALRELSAGAKERITPLIDVLRVAWDWEKDQPKKPLHKHLETIAKKIAQAWDEERSLFVDLFNIEPDERTADGTHPMRCLMDMLRKIGRSAIPVTGLDRDKAYQLAVRAGARLHSTGACIRLLTEDMEDIDSLDETIAGLLKALDLEASDAHLLLDFRHLEAENAEDAAHLAVAIINSLDAIDEFKTLTVAGSAFPGSLKDIDSLTIEALPRTELDVWQEVLSKAERPPTFGDYGICHPDFLDLDPRTFKLGGAIRYTLEDKWLIVKGGTFKKYKHDQFHDLARALTRHTSYMGHRYSWGDNYIAECAKRNVSTGNLMTWRKVGTNHHLTYVGQQVSKLGALQGA